MTSRLVKEKTASGATEIIAVDTPQQQEGDSEFTAGMAVRMEGVDIDSEAEDIVDNNDSDASGPATSILYQPGAGEAEFTFATMDADDMALDMDTKVGYITEDESSDENEDDLDSSMYGMS